MSIQGNWLSLVSWRAFSRNAANLDGNLRKLSSGQRINTAADDVAGLAISHNLMAQYRGLVQAVRNAMDGISLVDTAEGALQEIHAMLQRGRELSLQAANGVYTNSERQSIQTEINNILTEIDRIAETTTFNGRKLFNAGNSTANVARVVVGLKSGWLEQAANIIKTYYNIEGDISTLKITLENGGPSAAWISGTDGANGKKENLVLHVNVQQFGSSATGFMATMADDRKIARALTQATMARNVNYAALPDWFKSAAADYIAGRDEQLKEDIATYGAANVIAAMNTPWVDDSLHQSSAYLFLHYIAARMAPGDMQRLFNEMNLTMGARPLNTALLNVVGSSFAVLRAQFLSAGPIGGLSFLSTMNLADADVGSINPGDNVTVIPDGGSYNEDPLAPAFHVQLDAGNLLEPVRVDLQVGANFGDHVEVEIPHVSTLGLNLVAIDVVNRSDEAVDLFGAAVQRISSIRAQVGTYHNRLESTINANQVNSENQLGSFSRISDLDFAREMADFTRNQILVSSSSAMLAQANTIRQNVKWLLNGLSEPRSSTRSSMGMAFGMT